jgi:hypothetical protein
MKHLPFALALCALFLSSPACHATEVAGEEYPEGVLSEDKQIALLLKASEHTVAQLKALQATLSTFRAQEGVCVQSPRDSEALYKLSELALKLLNGIHETHIESYFRPAFLEELEKISKPAKNRVIPPISAP